MILKDFLSWYILPNSLIRLHYQNGGGFQQIESPKMEWQLKNSRYRYNNVIGVADILCVDGYSEAINIVIEELPLAEQRKMALEEIKTTKSYKNGN